MAGERTPDTGKGQHLGSSDDEISLREHIQRQLDVMRDSMMFRHDGLHSHTDTEIGHINRFNVEQDRRYEQRFAAQETAVQVALSRVDKEFHEHLSQVREETKAALDAADKAIIKSETATEKRFEGVNEFRAQLADQANTFARRDTAEAMVKTSDMRYQELIKTSDARYSEMKERFLPRAEHEARVSGLAEKIDVNIARLADLELRFSSRLDLTQGANEGGRMSIMDKRSANGAVLALVGMGITIVLAVITIVGFVIANMNGG